jgi:hypothetical protein
MDNDDILWRVTKLFAKSNVRILCSQAKRLVGFSIILYILDGENLLFLLSSEAGNSFVGEIGSQSSTREHHCAT